MNKRPKNKAVALRYDQAKSPAPRVTASGSGLVAQKIIETAREAGVYIKHDPDLLEVLAKVPVGETIPEELFQTVAELLAFVYRANNSYKEKLKTD
ncbi:MAG: EscU/YscU/HrcU family type III secretion system export apparatus switch protein [Desulfobulbaceae bacterium]|nr:EscU/YscU/HrcU family type III secretion system export apparatus switch protein [Desulfobulbaceae bacterium]